MFQLQNYFRLCQLVTSKTGADTGIVYNRTVGSHAVIFPLSMLSNRELASVIIVTTIAFPLFANTAVRNSLKHVIRSIFAKAIVCWAILTGLWIILGVYLLALFGLWEGQFLKETVIWGLTAGVLLAFRGTTSVDPEQFYRKALRDQLTVATFFGFYMNLKEFSLIFEILLQVSVLFFSVLSAVAGQKQEHLPVKKLVDWILAFIGLVTLATVSWKVFGDTKSLLIWATGKKFLFPILLAVWVVPLGYLLSLYAFYQQISIRLNSIDKDLRFYIKLRLFGVASVSHSRLKRCNSLLAGKLFQVENHDEIDCLFRALRGVLDDDTVTCSRDFLWSARRIEASDSERSIEDYCRAIKPLIVRSLRLTDHINGIVSKSDDDETICSRLPPFTSEADELWNQINLQEPVGQTLQRFDQANLSVISSLHTLLSFHSSEEQANRDFQNRAYLTKSYFRTLLDDWAAVFRAGKQIYRDKPKNLILQEINQAVGETLTRCSAD